jgi:hypothetical protein
VISVDTKKKELVGRFAQTGREWRPTGEPVEVSTYDFPDSADGKAIPYGVYDIADDSAWVCVGVDHDTSVFAVATIAKWWDQMGRHKYPNARRLLITADGGGSNGHRPWLWKHELAKLARPPAYRSSSATTRPAPANGTRSNTACSPASPATGAADPSRPTKPSSTSSPTPQQPPDSSSAANSTPTSTPPKQNSPTNRRTPYPEGYS